MNDPKLPRLRPLEAYPVRQDGVTYLVLQDEDGFSDKVVYLPPVEAFAATRLTGKTTAGQIRREIEKQTGPGTMPLERIRELVRVLDDSLMLDNERFAAHRRGVLEAFRAGPDRPAHLAGRGYPAEPEALRRELDSHFAAPDGPGDPPPLDGTPPLTGLVAPHIDYRRGHAGYGWAYREVLRSGLADLYVILGVAHRTPPAPFVLTEKDYATPLGAVPTDRRLAAELSKRAGFDLRSEELVHRTEHSIEFQAVHLARAAERLGGECLALPLLASSCDLTGSDPGKRTKRFLPVLAELLSGFQGTVCLLAGVDFAHIGPRFGDEQPAEGEFLERTKREDAASIERLLAQDPDAFLESVMFDDNKRKVCGVSALYAFSWLHRELFPKAKGSLLHYSHAADPAGGEVTFASAAFR